MLPAETDRGKVLLLKVLSLKLQSRQYTERVGLLLQAAVPFLQGEIKGTRVFVLYTDGSKPDCRKAQGSTPPPVAGLSNHRLKGE